MPVSVEVNKHAAIPNVELTTTMAINEKDEIVDHKSVDEIQKSCFSKTSDWLLSLRYYIILLTGCPVPGLSANVPIIGGKTAIELLLSAAIIAIGSVAAGGSGSMADIFGAITILLSMRYNILTLIFGISFERAIWWHKVVAVLAIIAVGIHSQKGTNLTGIVILACMCLAAASYFVKPYWFELFYYVHIGSYLVIIPVTMLHFSAQFFTYAAVFWVIDLVLRYAITQHKAIASASILPGDVVRLKFNKNFSYKPGQYVFLLIPGVHRFEYHPFSISSSPEDEYITIHIRALGDWTKKLELHIKDRLESEQTDTIDITMYVEGPYGTHQINLDSPKYEVLMLISGGIGITPLQSLHNDLVHQVRNGRHMRKVLFLWSVKDRATIDAMHDHHKENENAYLPMSFQPTMQPAPRIRAEGYNTRTVNPVDVEEGAIANKEDIQSMNSSYVFLNEFYLTQVRDEKDFDATGIHPTVQSWLKFGRPDLDDYFERTRQMCLSEGIKRVGVCVCGPQKMVDKVKDLCHRSHLHPDPKTIRFDCHSELFDF